MMKTLVVWRLQGFLRRVGEPRHSSKRDYREVLVAVDGDFTAQAIMNESEALLLHNWSNQDHLVEVVGLSRVMVDNKYGGGKEQMAVISP